MEARLPEPTRRPAGSAIDDRDPARVWEAWAAAVYRLLSPYQQYIGLSWDALDHFVPIDVRNEWNLFLSLPGHR
jgi:hypothetical protein